MKRTLRPRDWRLDWQHTTMDYRIDQVLHFHLRCYQLLGMHGLPLPGDSHPRRLARILHFWAGSLLLGLSTVVCICLTSDDVYLYQGDAFSYCNDVMKFGFAEMAILSIFWETLSAQRVHLGRFWQLYGSLAARHMAMTPPWPGGNLRRQVQQHRRFLAIFYGSIVLELVLFGLFMYMQDVSRHILLFWATFQPFIFIVHLRNTQFILHLDLLHQELRQLEDELVLLVDYTGFASGSVSFNGFAEYLRRRLREKQFVYGRIFELCSLFKRGFTYSVLTVLLMIHIRITVDCYFFYYTTYKNIENLDYYLMLPAMLQIPAFLHISQSCMQMVPRIAYQLHNVSSSSSTVSVQIQNFSLQILHEPVHIDCLGIVKLDNHLLTRIAYAVCIYMIFAVQLMPKLNGPYA